MKLLITEIGIMKTSRHENIVNYMDSFIVDERYLWVVMDYMDGGCLTDVMEQFDQLKMTEPQISFVCRQVHLFFHLSKISRHWEHWATSTDCIASTEILRVTTSCWEWMAPSSWPILDSQLNWLKNNNKETQLLALLIGWLLNWFEATITAPRLTSGVWVSCSWRYPNASQYLMD